MIDPHFFPFCMIPDFFLFYFVCLFLFYLYCFLFLLNFIFNFISYLFFRGMVIDLPSTCTKKISRECDYRICFWEGRENGLTSLEKHRDWKVFFFFFWDDRGHGILGEIVIDF